MKQGFLPMSKSTQILAKVLNLVPRLVNAEIGKMELPRGEKGDRGEPGEVGARGQRGKRGTEITNLAIIDDELVVTLDNAEVLPVGRVVGPEGPPGPVGARGIAGEDGAPGVPGPVGARGPEGIAGIAGEAGPPGVDGVNGADGATGPAGEVGARGAPGTPGEAGEQGPQGEPGIDGKDGEQGPPGEPGEPGRGVEKAWVDQETGMLAIAYTDGTQNSVGYIIGERGIPGSVGRRGLKGKAGDPGEVGLGLLWAGEYESDRTYYGQLDESNPARGQASLVRYKGTTYIALTETSEVPSATANDWEVFI